MNSRDIVVQALANVIESRRPARPSWWTRHDEELHVQARLDDRSNPGALTLRVCRLCVHWESNLGLSGGCDRVHWREVRSAKGTCQQWEGHPA